MDVISAGVSDDSAYALVWFWWISTSPYSGTNSSVCLQFVTPFGGGGIKQMFGLTYVLTFVAGIS